MDTQHWVTLFDVSNSDAQDAIAEFARICNEHEMDEETADTLWAASQVVLCHLLKENGELPRREELTEFSWDD